MRGKKPVAKIVGIEQPEEKQLPFRLIGAFRGKIHFDDSALRPATDEDLIEMGFDDLVDAPIVPSPGIPSEEK